MILHNIKEIKPCETNDELMHLVMEGGQEVFIDSRKFCVSINFVDGEIEVWIEV